MSPGSRLHCPCHLDASGVHCISEGILLFPYNLPSPHLKPLTCSPAPQAVFNHPSQEQHRTCPLSCSAALQSIRFCPLGTDRWQPVFPSPETTGKGREEVSVMQFLHAHPLWLNCACRAGGCAEGLYPSSPATAVMTNMFCPCQGFVPSVWHPGGPGSQCGGTGFRFPICATSEMANAAEKETTQRLGLWGVDALRLPLPWQAEVMQLQARRQLGAKAGLELGAGDVLCKAHPLPWTPRWLMQPLHSSLEFFHTRFVLRKSWPFLCYPGIWPELHRHLGCLQYVLCQRTGKGEHLPARGRMVVQASAM